MFLFFIYFSCAGERKRPVCGHQHPGGGVQHLQGGGGGVGPCAPSGSFQRPPEERQRRCSLFSFFFLFNLLPADQEVDFL